jgi:hypothetical protein
MASRITALFASLVLAASVEAAAADSIENNLSKAISGSGFASGITALAAEKAEASLGKARAGIGMLTFMKGIERFSQAMYRHGFNPGSKGLMPLFFGTNLPVGNPDPKPLTYADMRKILADLSADMEAADVALAAVGETAFALPVDIHTLRIDIDGDGKATEAEQLFALAAPLSGIAQSKEPFIIRFDTADVQWLRGYSNLLGAVADFWLTHDFEASFDVGFPALFPRSVPADRSKVMPDEAGAQSSFGGDMRDIADVIALIHKIDWPVTEAARGPKILKKLLTVAELNRATWRLARAETDNDREWLPNAKQNNAVLPGMFVTDERIDAWLKSVAELEEVLQGKRLVPHWRFSPRDTSLAFLDNNASAPPKTLNGLGINMKKMLEAPQRLDAVLLLTGHGALPYLEKGDLASFAAWNQAERIFEGDLLTYAFWFN